MIYNVQATGVRFDDRSLVTINEQVLIDDERLTITKKRYGLKDPKALKIIARDILVSKHGLKKVTVTSITQ